MRIKINNASVLDGHIIYFAAENGNGLFKYDMEIEQVTLLGRFPGEKENRVNLFSSCVKYGKYLIFPAFNAERTAIYNLDTNIFEESISSTEKNIYHVVRAVAFEDKIYLLGSWLNPIVAIMERQQRGWISRILCACKTDLMFGENFFWASSGANRKGDEVYVPMSNPTGMFKLNMRNETYEIIDMEDDCVQNMTVYADDKFLYVGKLNGEIIKMDYEGKKLSSCGVLPKDFQMAQTGWAFCAMLTYKDKLLLIPARANYIVCMDLDLEAMRTICFEKGDEVDAYGEDWEKYTWIEQRESKLYLARNYDGSIWVLDLDDNSCCKIEVEDKWGIAIPYEVNGVYMENRDINTTVGNFLECINGTLEQVENGTANIGDIIYNKLR